ncbi:MAG: hypothetical protein JSW00_02025 [Thermoplasmata archaeon]|nr:MAG: hypothetical protein JSW00_02025 [Thermoplasmata archaeon]
MRRSLALYTIITTFCVFAGIASAGEPDVSANNVIGIEPEEEFDLVIFVESHADDSNYTVIVTLHRRFEFVENKSDMIISGDEASITLEGDDKDELRFEFPMMAEEDTPEGSYHIDYEAYWNGSETDFENKLIKMDSVRVSVGEGGRSSCSTTDFLILPVLAIGLVFCIVKKEKR